MTYEFFTRTDQDRIELWVRSTSERGTGGSLIGWMEDGRFVRFQP